MIAKYYRSLILSTDLLAIGSVGMLQNIFVVGCARRPEAFGIHTELIDTISDDKVSKVLAKVEKQYPLVGSSLLPIFYPAGFRAPADQKKFWKFAIQRRHTVITDINADSVDGAMILSETHSKVLDPVEYVTKGDQEARAEMISCRL